jgi:hypothetical protein
MIFKLSKVIPYARIKLFSSIKRSFCFATLGTKLAGAKLYGLRVKIHVKMDHLNHFNKHVCKWVIRTIPSTKLALWQAQGDHGLASQNGRSKMSQQGDIAHIHQDKEANHGGGGRSMESRVADAGVCAVSSILLPCDPLCGRLGAAEHIHGGLLGWKVGKVMCHHKIISASQIQKIRNYSDGNNVSTHHQ